MRNMAIGVKNRIDSCTISGGSYQSGLPLSNIKIRQLSQVARTMGVNTTSSIINIDQGSALATGLISIAGHNFSSVSKVRITMDNVGTMAEPEYDSGWVKPYPNGMIPQSLLEWEDSNFWFGVSSQNTVSGYGNPFIHVIPSRPVQRYCRIEIDDSTNTDNFIHFGRVFIGDAWTPKYNATYGLTCNVIDKSEIEESLNLTEYYNQRRRCRELNFTLDCLTDDEAYGRVLDMLVWNGITGEIVVVVDPDDVGNSHRRNIYGRLKSISPLTYINFGQKTVSFNVKEII